MVPARLQWVIPTPSCLRAAGWMEIISSTNWQVSHITGCTIGRALLKLGRSHRDKRKETKAGCCDTSCRLGGAFKGQVEPRTHTHALARSLARAHHSQRQRTLFASHFISIAESRRCTQAKTAAPSVAKRSSGEMLAFTCGAWRRQRRQKLRSCARARVCVCVEQTATFQTQSLRFSCEVEQKNAYVGNYSLMKNNAQI